MQTRMTRRDLGLHGRGRGQWWADQYDASMMGARTGFLVQWDGRFNALCPHGHVVEWLAVPFSTTYPLCACGEPR